MDNKKYHKKKSLEMNNVKGWNQKYIKKNSIKNDISIKKNEENMKNNEISKTNLKTNLKTNIKSHNFNYNQKYQNLLMIKEETTTNEEKLANNDNNNKKIKLNNVLNQKKIINKKNYDINKINFISNQNEDKKEKIKFNIPSLIILENIGNTTYINSVIRIISNILDISKYYIDKIKTIDKNIHKMPISFVYARILYHLYILPPQNYSLEKFYKALISLNPIYKGDETKDSIDFLIYFLNQLHEENKKILYYNQNNNEIDFQNYDKYINYLKENENTKINASFCWINKKVLKCWGCNNEKISFQKFLTYDLDFENALNKTFFINGYNNNTISVFDCIKYTSEEKNIYNVFCDKCNKKNNFKKISSIALSSKYIIFLIRGNDKEFINKIRENQIRIHIDKMLDFSQLFENNKLHYTIYGFILYDTEKLEYISYCKCPFRQKWYKYSREEITAIELNEFINNYNYKLFPVILLYEAY